MKVTKFRITDLLAIITTISLVLFILLPVLAGGRDQSMKVICLSHIKSLGMAMLMYVQDNNGMFPPQADFLPTPKPSGTPIPGTFWDARIRPYVSNDKIYQCPTYQKTGSTSTYAVNMNLTYWSYTMEGRIVFPPEAGSISSVKDPNIVIMLVDAKFQLDVAHKIGDGESTRYFWRKEFNMQGVPMTHDGGDNICFVDGHARWYKTSEAEPKDFKGAVDTWNGISFFPLYEPK